SRGSPLLHPLAMLPAGGQRNLLTRMTIRFRCINLMTFHAQSNKPKLVEEFFGPGGIKDKQVVYTGEMLEHYLGRTALGESLPDGVEKKFRLIESAKARKIYTVLLTKEGKSEDWIDNKSYG